MAQTVFKATVTSPGGLEMKVESRGFIFTIDEPENLGGTNKGMNPVEVLLGALGACIGICIQSFAPVHHIKVNSFTVNLEGDLDPDGFMGINPDAKKGYSEVRTYIEIDADNSEEEIHEFIKFVEGVCPINDTITNSPVSKMFVNGKELA